MGGINWLVDLADVVAGVETHANGWYIVSEGKTASITCIDCDEAFKLPQQKKNAIAHKKLHKETLQTAIGEYYEDPACNYCYCCSVAFAQCVCNDWNN